MNSIIQAVVLRVEKADPKRVVLYTPTQGRIIAFDVCRAKPWQALSHGDVVYATLRMQQHRWFLDGVESVITQQDASAFSSFFWRMHILDLFLSYVPLQQPHEELFYLLVKSMQIAQAPCVVFKIFITHFFALQGLPIPEHIRWYRLMLQHIDSASYTAPQTYTLNSAPQSAAYEALSQWLVRTISEHDHFRYLKTQSCIAQLYSVGGVSI